jgi:hypothetical protein
MAASEIFEKSEAAVHDIFSKGRDLLAEASEWAPRNKPLVAGIAGAVVAVGAVGFLLGRAGRRKAEPSSRERMATVSALPSRLAERPAVQTPEINLEPVFKFLKLWMLYRIAV